MIQPLSQVLTCFKAYDIRGQIPAQINEDICYRIGRAFAQVLGAKSIVVGHDIRLTSPVFCDAVSAAFWMPVVTSPISASAGLRKSILRPPTVATTVGW